uniref:Ig-like domain-containing protein n=1 Tax=Vespula pensylvanica TaxID=30213 RepID=A0A834UA55_VESPE|nr:hypothetical protein H0235_007790 [Vespula pensylvanica]
MEEGANSTLSIARVGPADSGNYTCMLTTMPDQPATVHVHVLNDTSIALSSHRESHLRIKVAVFECIPRCFRRKPSRVASWWFARHSSGRLEFSATLSPRHSRMASGAEMKTRQCSLRPSQRHSHCRKLNYRASLLQRGLHLSELQWENLPSGWNCFERLVREQR